ncbi:family 6 glucosyltransferase [Acinetobacter ihumii]|uniref:family 6 glucosyltransferase n=1 Tax=Acinetobacter ihumii TaxID=2483802 RepID=UPI0010323198|nr:family 6 glucosyltransferase [Acinetobacter ihumii]
MLNTDLNQASIAILYIATGRYTVFWQHFYESAEKNLLRSNKKHYFVFTDDAALLNKSNLSNVTYIQQEKLGWPYDTLMRFEIFLSQKDKLKEYDFVFFFNANTEIVKEVTSKEFLPEKQDENLIFALQPHSFHKRIDKFTYDRNPESTAYIDYNSGKFYFTGALNGGRCQDYLNMCETLNKNTKIDLENNVIALWHDESHLNKYALNREDIKILPAYFTRGETEYWKKSAKIMFSDKSHFRFGGHAYLRSETNEKITENDWLKTKSLHKKRYAFRLKQYIKSFLL